MKTHPKYPVRERDTGERLRLLFWAAIALGLILALTNCVPKAIIVEPITPAVTEAKGQVRAATAATERTRKQATETAQRVSEVREGIEEAIDHAVTTRASKAPGSPEAAEWEAQWKLLTEARTRNLFAEASANSTLTQSKEAQTLADAASKSMDTLESHAKETDQSTADLKTENTKLGQDAGTWRGIKKAAWTLGIIAVVAVIALTLLRRAGRFPF